jgi:uncharacterized protein YuzE
MRGRPGRAAIRVEWIEHVVAHPVKEHIQHDGRIRRWAPIPEMDGRYLRLILLPDGKAVHNAFFDRSFHHEIRYFQDTDTLHIEFRHADVAETRDLDKDTMLDVGAEGKICGTTVEHAKNRIENIPHVSFEEVAV